MWVNNKMNTKKDTIHNYTTDARMEFWLRRSWGEGMYALEGNLCKGEIFTTALEYEHHKHKYFFLFYLLGNLSGI